tara:strand:- start:4204 stop:5064 length:861 start_codon:yes stop_codon:yes gene_type:complete
MGLTFHEYKFLEEISKKGNFGSILTLGKQEMILTKEDKKRLNLIEKDYSNDEYIDKLLIDKFKAVSVKSIDNSSFEGADIIHDMNKPFSNFKQKFDTIIDFGTSEHIFNVAQNFKNISELCKVNGIIIHSLPANNNCGHGFWQFSPELFFSLYSENNGFLETEVFIFNTHNKYEWWKVEKQKLGERLEINSDTPLYVLVKTVKKSEIQNKSVQQSDYIERWNDNSKNYQIIKKKKLSVFWKNIKDNYKKFFIRVVLPKRLSQKLEGKRILLKNSLKKNKNLKNIKF